MGVMAWVFGRLPLLLPLQGFLGFWTFSTNGKLPTNLTVKGIFTVDVTVTTFS